MLVQLHVANEVVQVHCQSGNMEASPRFSRISMSAKVRHKHEVVF